MPLTDAQRAALVAEARSEGVDPDDLIAEAEAEAEESEGGPPTSVSSEAPKMFQYHLPGLRVNEVRAMLGLGAVPDGDMFWGQWLAKYGGAS